MPLEERLDVPELVRRDAPEVERDRVLDDFEVERDFVPVLEPPLRDFVPEVERLVVRRELDDPPLRDFVPRDCCEPPESSSPFDPRSFLPTPTAAAVASPTAAPVTTFFGVDISSMSEPSSSAILVSPPSRR